MPRKHVFGLTPWGAAFITAMERLGDAGRLDRGRSYAGNDKVQKLKIEAGVATARVKGSYQPFYTVRIAFPPFSEKDKEIIANLLAKDQLALARLGAGSFSPDLLDRLDKAGVKLFPRRWADMKRSCDCPDWGDPCKHEAAVYYIIAQEIDRDPTALFRLRGYEMPVRPVAAVQANETSDPLALNFVDHWQAPVDLPIEPGVPEISEGQALGYPASLPPLASYADLITKLLPPGPALAGLDLRLALTEFYHRLARDWEEPFGSGNLSGASDSQLRSLAYSDFQLEVQGAPTPSSAIVLQNGKKLSPLGTAILVLQADTDEGSASWRFLRRFAQAMRSIVAAGAFHPAIRVEGDSFSVVWKPARFGADVREALSWVEALAVEPCPIKSSKESPTTGSSKSKSSKGKPARKQKTGGIPDRPSLVSLLATDFLKDYVASLEFSPTGAQAANSPVSGALFTLSRIATATPALRSLPRSLAARLAVYDLACHHGAFELSVKNAAPRSAKSDGAGENPSDTGTISHNPRYALSAHTIDQDGKRRLLSKAGTDGGAENLAFPALLSSFVPALAALGTKASVELGEKQLGDLVVEAAPLLTRIGVPVILPKELSKLSRPRPVMTAKRKGTGNLTSVLDLGSAFDFQWSVAIGDSTISPDEFEALVAKGSVLYRFRDSYLRLDPAEAAAILERIRRARKADTFTAIQASLAGEADFQGEIAELFRRLLSGKAESDPNALSGRATRRGKSNQGINTAQPALALPAGLTATLRPYQERGYRWLLANLENGFGCLLADDMGLGKTIQTLAAILNLKETGKLQQGALIIAPASLLTNWEREIAKFAPGLSVHSHYGTKRRLAKADIVLTTYETFLRDMDKGTDKGTGNSTDKAWDLGVLDEAHLVKNPDTKRSRAVKALKAARRIALTGTPVENNLAELWSIFDYALPGYLGTLANFAKDFRKPIEVNRSPETAERLRRITEPFILRRLKTDKEIAPDLPEKVVIDEYALLTPEQAALYKAVADEGLTAIAEAEGISRRGRILALITALKQVSNHPRNWDKESAPAAEHSGKARLLLALLDSSLAAGERVIVFSQYVEMLHILDGIVRKDLGMIPFVLHGGMAKSARDAAVDGFQNGTGPGIFLISLKAGGVGLNLTAASRVVHYDLWFNPAVENQATDRAFRIGQTKNVFVHRLVTRGTLEEKINVALVAKRELADLTVRAGETWLTELGTEEIRALVSL